MEFAGIIESPPDPPGLDHAAWLELIASRDDLVTGEPSEATNPFTGEEMTVYPRPDFAQLIVNGQAIGSFSWAQDDKNVLVVSGELGVMQPYAEEIAKSLHGVFVPFVGVD